MNENSEDKITDLFSLIDVENDIKISNNIFKEMLRTTLGDQFSEEEFEKLLKEMEVDENGNVALSSFPSTALSKQNIRIVPLDLDSLEKMFQSKIDGEEFNVLDWRNALNGIGINLSETKVEELMNLTFDFMKQQNALDDTQFGEVVLIDGVDDAMVSEMKDTLADKADDILIGEAGGSIIDGIGALSIDEVNTTPVEKRIANDNASENNQQEGNT